MNSIACVQSKTRLGSLQIFCALDPLFAFTVVKCTQGGLKLNWDACFQAAQCSRQSSSELSNLPIDFVGDKKHPKPYITQQGCDRTEIRIKKMYILTSIVVFLHCK